MARPDGHRFLKTHEWARMDGEFAWIGITDYAVSHLSDLVFLDLPDVGDVQIALLRDRRAADSLAHADEHVIGRSPVERAETKRLIGKELVDPGPVVTGIHLVQLVDGRLEDVVEFRVVLDHPRQHVHEFFDRQHVG